MIDTGAFATLLHRPFVKRMKIPLHDAPIQLSSGESARTRCASRAHSEAETACDTVYTLIAQSPDVIARSFQGSSALVRTGVR
jgi:hypothetical protein